jgi:hypothetical protein
MVLLLGLVAGAAGGVGSLLLYERSDAVREKIAGLGSLLPQQNQSADDPVFFLAENNLIPENNNSEPAQETAVAGVTGPVASSDPVAVAEPADKAAGSAKTKTDPAAEAVITDADEATEEVFAAVTEPAGDTQTYPLISALPPPAKPSTMQMTPEITPEQPQSPAADIAGEASAAVTPPLLPAPVQAETAASTPQLLDPAVIEGMAAWLQTIRTNLVLPSFVKKPVEPLTAAADEPAEPETAVTDEPPVPSVRQTAAIDEPGKCINALAS